MVGPRVIGGWGAGTFDHEFEAIGMGGIFRPELVESNARIFERVFAEDNVDYSDDHYEFSNVSVYPKPAGPIPFWYGGATPASAGSTPVVPADGEVRPPPSFPTP